MGITTSASISLALTFIPWPHRSPLLSAASYCTGHMTVTSSQVLPALPVLKRSHDYDCSVRGTVFPDTTHWVTGFRCHKQENVM